MTTKTFRVARAGQTTDGREITRDHITQMAAGYSPEVYGARVNLEHYRGFSPNSDFRCYGDVVSLSTEEVGDHLYLLAEIAPTPELIALAKSKQKVYFSIEFYPEFADTKEAYMVGLACTDSPASLGTSYMQFCQQNPNENPLSARKQNPDTYISTAESAWEYKEEPKSVFATVKDMFAAPVTPKTEKDKELATAQAFAQLPDTIKGFQDVMQTMASAIDTINASVGHLNTTVSDFAEKQNEVETSLKNVQNNLDTTPADNYTQRPTATGSSDYVKSDC
ncbi:GPO family capsid scaffolding protein [Psychrobacter alimentarius]|uniref:GPO family capsid scaffolding protein n=1 Tax=Psychrobacter alimentarius TaxID=261164 RepID=UPI003FD2DAF5